MIGRRTHTVCHTCELWTFETRVGPSPDHEGSARRSSSCRTLPMAQITYIPNLDSSFLSQSGTLHLGQVRVGRIFRQYTPLRLKATSYFCNERGMKSIQIWLSMLSSSALSHSQGKHSVLSIPRLLLLSWSWHSVVEFFWFSHPVARKIRWVISCLSKQ